MKRILIVKLAAIGDVITALPMVSSLKRREPCHITWMVTKSIAPLCHIVEGIDEVIGVDDMLLKGSWRELLKVWGKLLGRSFDKVIVAHVDPRYRLLTWTLRAKERRSFYERPISGRYRGDEYLRLVDDHKGALSTRPENFPALRLPLLPKSGAIILVPGGAKNVMRDDSLRRWSLESYKNLAAQLIELGHSVTLIGSAQDAWAKEAFQGMSVEDLIGKTDLVTLLKLIQSASLMVSHDTGPLHMARLVGTKVIGLFGPIDPYEICGSSSSVLKIWKGREFACAPCYDGKNYAKCQNNLCMKAISVDDVLAVLRASFGSSISC